MEDLICDLGLLTMHEDQPVPPQAAESRPYNATIMIALLVAIGAVCCVCLGATFSVTKMDYFYSAAKMEQDRPSQAKNIVFVPINELLSDSRMTLGYNLKDGVDIIKKNIEYIHLHRKVKWVDYFGIVGRNENGNDGKSMATFGFTSTTLNCTYNMMTTNNQYSPHHTHAHPYTSKFLTDDMPYHDIILLGTLNRAQYCAGGRSEVMCIDYSNRDLQNGVWMLQRCH